MADFAITTRPASRRTKDFDEVVVGLGKKEAVEHARIYLERETSLQGDNCLLGTDYISFLKFLAKGNINGALEVICQNNPLPAVTGRFSDEPYAKTDVRDRENKRISLRALERFVADNGNIKSSDKSKHMIEKVAIIGSGPSGLTTAAFLARNNFDVHVFESYPVIGGSLRYAISEFRMPHKVLDTQIQYIQSLGITFHPNMTFGLSMTVPELFRQGFKAVYLESGAGVAKMLDISGREAQGIFSADEVLMDINLMHAERNSLSHTPLEIGRRVVVIGGGNAAVDCARSLLRLGRDVTLVIRGAVEDLQVKSMVRRDFEEENIKVEPFANTVKYLVDECGIVKGISCRRLDYADLKENNQWELMEVKDSDFDILADSVVVAVGHSAHPAMFKNWPELKLNRDHTIWTEKDSCATSVEGVFAGGNAAEGPGPLLWAMLSGKKAALEIAEFAGK